VLRNHIRDEPYYVAGSRTANQITLTDNLKGSVPAGVGFAALQHSSEQHFLILQLICLYSYRNPRHSVARKDVPDIPVDFIGKPDHLIYFFLFIGFY
jgi:hypothetical protein